MFKTNLFSDKQTINLSGIVYNSLVNGEGTRCVIFLAGCSKKCPGCHNEKLQDADNGYDVSIDYIMKTIEESKVAYLIDGFTISGGDPLEQPKQTLELCKRLKEDFDTNIWIYTGELFEDIEKRFPELLQYSDIIVDGRYIESLNDGKSKFRGSSNQRIIDTKTRKEIEL